MAGDPLRKVTPGDPQLIPAAAYNLFVDAARAHQHRDRRGGGAVQTARPDAGVILVRNGTEAAVDRFAVLAVAGPVIDPGDDEGAFASRVALEGDAPADPVEAGNWVVTLEPIPAGGIGRAVAAGVAIVRLNVGGGVEAFAEAAAGVTGYLAASATGTARVLWVETGAESERWAVVRLGDGADSQTVQVKGGTTAIAAFSASTIDFDPTYTTITNSPSGEANFSLVVASATTGGVLTDVSQSIKGEKTFVDDIYGPDLFLTGDAHFDDGYLYGDSLYFISASPFDPDAPVTPYSRLRYTYADNAAELSFYYVPSYSSGTTESVAGGFKFSREFDGPEGEQDYYNFTLFCNSGAIFPPDPILRYRIDLVGTIFYGQYHENCFGDVYTGGIITTAASAYNLDDLDNVSTGGKTTGDLLGWNGSAWAPVDPDTVGGGGVEYLDDLADVTITTPAEDEVLVYNGSAWVNAAVPAPAIALDDLTDVVIASPEDGQILVYDNDINTWKNVDPGDVGIGADYLADLDDCSISAPAVGHVLVWDGSVWVDHGRETTPDEDDVLTWTSANRWEAAPISTPVASAVSGMIGSTIQAQDPLLQDIADLSDPGDDRILFWDDSEGEIAWLDLGHGLATSGATLNRVYHGARAYQGSNQSISSGGWTTVTFGSETHDTDSIHSGGTFTIPTGMGGKWRFTARGSFYNAASNTVCRFRLYANGTTEIDYTHVYYSTTIGIALMEPLAYEGAFSAGDTVVLQVNPDVSGNVLGGTQYCWMSAEYLGV